MEKEGAVKFKDRGREPDFDKITKSEEKCRRACQAALTKFLLVSERGW